MLWTGWPVITGTRSAARLNFLVPEPGADLTRTAFRHTFLS